MEGSRSWMSSADGAASESMGREVCTISQVEYGGLVMRATHDGRDDLRHGVLAGLLRRDGCVMIIFGPGLGGRMCKKNETWTG